MTTIVTKDIAKEIKEVLKLSRESLSIRCDKFKPGWRFAEENKAIISAGGENGFKEIEVGVDMIDYRDCPAKEGEYVKMCSALLCYSATARTFLRSVKVGDKIRIRFIAGNDTDSMREAGFTQNETRGIIQRGNNILEYSLGNEVVRNDNPLRMVRPW